MSPDLGRPTRLPYRGRLIGLGGMSEENTPSRLADRRPVNTRLLVLDAPHQ